MMDLANISRLASQFHRFASVLKGPVIMATRSDQCTRATTAICAGVGAAAGAAVGALGDYGLGIIGAIFGAIVGTVVGGIIASRVCPAE
jgi:hypothetical protein